MVIGTQNPNDLDHRVVGNSGTWMIGHLHTARDKERILERIEATQWGAAAQQLDPVIGSLQQRQFLMTTPHRDDPIAFQTRWTLSYLRPPLPSDQQHRLSQVTTGTPPDPDSHQPPAPAETPPTSPTRTLIRSCEHGERPHYQSIGGGFYCAICGRLDRTS